MMEANPASIRPEGADSRHWERLLSGEGGTVLDLQVGDRDDILAVTRLGLFRSLDRGEHWHRIEAPPLVQTLHRSAGWWLGTDVGLFRTDRLDGSWQPVLSRTVVSAVWVEDQSDLLLIATVEEGLLRSEDRGTTWEDANPGLPGDDIIAIHPSPQFERDQTIFVVTGSGLFRSRNGGRAWRQIALDTDDIECFAILKDQLLVGTGTDGVWMSGDAGRTWRQAISGEAIIGFGASTSGNTIVLSDTGLFRLDANGNTMSHAFLPPHALCAIETSDRILVGTIGHGVHCLQPVSGKFGAASTGLEATARDRARSIGHAGVVTTSGSGAILHSADGEAAWSELSETPLGSVIDFDARVDANGAVEIVACDGQSAGVFRERWQRLEADFPLAVAWLDDGPGVLTRDGDFIRQEFRSSLFPWRPRLTGARLIPLCGRPDVLWAVLQTDNAGVIVLRSPDSGHGWEPLLQTDAIGAVSLAITIDQTGSEVALLAVGNRVYRVLESSQPVWTGDDSIAISAIAIAPNGCILIATNRGLIAVSEDFVTSELVPGSPAPLLDIDIETTGNAIVIERGGSIWRLALA